MYNNSNKFRSFDEFPPIMSNPHTQFYPPPPQYPAYQVPPMGYGMPLPEPMPWGNQNYEMVPVPMNGNNQQYRMIDEREVFFEIFQIFNDFWMKIKKETGTAFYSEWDFRKTDEIGT